MNRRYPACHTGPVAASKKTSNGNKRVRLKDIADRLGVSPATVSLVLNRAPAGEAISQATKDRVIATAKEMGYRPDLLARSLRYGTSLSIGVLVPYLGEDYSAGVMGGVEKYLAQNGYFCLTASHRWDHDLLTENLNRLKDRSVDGLILVGTPVDESPGLPAVAVAGRQALPGVTNVVIDHDIAADLALSYLTEHGHEHIAFLKGHPLNADTPDRWRAISRTAEQKGIKVRDKWTKQLSDLPDSDPFSPEARYRKGYEIGRELLAEGGGFTALFSFNDVSAIGATRAFLDAGLEVPGDISVIGFDDIKSAKFQNPSLTTIHQPLAEMGELAARTLIDRLRGREEKRDFLMVEPSLIVRNSSGPARSVLSAS